MEDWNSYEEVIILGNGRRPGPWPREDDTGPRGLFWILETGGALILVPTRVTGVQGYQLDLEAKAFVHLNDLR